MLYVRGQASHGIIDSLRVSQDDPVVVVGHDLGLMVAYAYAQAYRGLVSHLVVADAPPPGTAVFDRLRADPRVWHFAFHGARDVAEMLVAGRERQYLQAFFGARVADPSAISDADLDVYASAYSAPGAMRAGFELSRAFDQDAADNRAALRDNGKLDMPVLAVDIPGTAHWIPEENPEAFARAVLDLAGR